MILDHHIPCNVASRLYFRVTAYRCLVLDKNTAPHDRVIFNPAEFPDGSHIGHQNMLSNMRSRIKNNP